MVSRTSEINAAIKLIRDQYEEDDRPWYLGFSGGKDSTALFAAVYYAMLRIPHLHKSIVLLYCDTGVEIPVIAEYVKETLVRIKKQAKEDGIPIKTKIVSPRVDDRFFVKVIGKGYPPPTNKFRWCTDRLRVGPVRREMQTASGKSSFMLLGTRWEESPERTRTLARFKIKGRYFFRQAGNANTIIFAPLADFSTKQIWEFLHSCWIPSSLNISELVSLYRAANGDMCSGRCQDCPKCKGARFGCWTCTVVRKDRAVMNMVNGGHPQLGPLLEFRDWLAELRNQTHLRYKRRRNGKEGPGPFTMQARRAILSRLRETQERSPWALLQPIEVQYIKKCWERDNA